MKKGLLRRLFVAVLALVTLSACSTDLLDGLIPENDSKSIIRTENSTGAERLFDNPPCIEETGEVCEGSSPPASGEKVSWNNSGSAQGASQYPMSVEIDLGQVYFFVDLYIQDGSEELQENGALNVYAKRNLFDAWQPVGVIASAELEPRTPLQIFLQDASTSIRYVRLEFANEAKFFNISEAYFTVDIEDETGEGGGDDCPPEECEEAPGKSRRLVP